MKGSAKHVKIISIMLLNLFYIGLGGFIGSIARFLTYQATDSLYHKTNFPMGTLAVNLLGSFLIGIALALALKHQLFVRHSMLHYLFISGFLGAFTTFSTFSQDNLVLLLNKNYFLFGCNLMLNVFLGLGLVFLGYAAVNR